jgi:hypothetical protein
VGDLFKTYDEGVSDNSTFRTGFWHDISLIKPIDPATIRNVRCGASKWYVDGTIDTRSKLHVLGGSRMECRGVPKRWGNPLEPVGQGIMFLQKSLPQDQRWTAEDIQSLMCRCVLWRPLNPVGNWDGWSGAPVIVDRELHGKQLLGFHSFAQYTNHPQPPSDMENLLRADFAAGYVSFGACMTPPQELLNAVIVE